MWGGLLFSNLALACLSTSLAADLSVLLTKENVVEATHPRIAWSAAEVGQTFAERDRVRTGELSRASLRLTDLSTLRLAELTELELREPAPGRNKPTLELQGGSIFFFSREKPQELHIRTPLANGALRGTELHVSVAANGRTVVTVLEGEMDLSNALGRILLHAGEQGTVAPGRAPVKTAMIEAVNIIQWCLYYPGVLSVSDLGLSPAESGRLRAPVAAYEAGDLLGALRLWPADYQPVSPGERALRAALMLSVGQVTKAEEQLARMAPGDPKTRALRRLIAAVKGKEDKGDGQPRTASEWVAESYYRQARAELPAARAAAARATELVPDFGFAWTRRAELEFSFGEAARSMQILDRGLSLAPRQAEAAALQGFYLAAMNRIPAARRAFEHAIQLDGALANGWLGRGLTEIRQGEAVEGRRDLQTAAALEPNRSLLRSYLGKAWSQVGAPEKAGRELARAKEIDPRDPTPWLYSAIERKQENRYNEAVSELERSYALNDNRRLFRSDFLLDEDRAVRGTNLAAIYQNDGLVEQSVREAVRAVGDDYGSAPAHLFLANSYNALRDPQRVQLRYETPWFHELLLSHLLSPVGGGPLSQYVSEEEYSKLFERDGLGFSSLTELYSRGELRETASQYGTAGNLAYALDYEGLLSNGVRPNDNLDRHEAFATFKLQLGPSDTLFAQVRFQDYHSGYLFQLTDPRTLEKSPTVNELGQNVFVPNRPALTYHYGEEQYPGLAIAGWHHEWAPGQHSLLLVTRLADEQSASSSGAAQQRLVRDTTLTPELLTAYEAPLSPETEPEIVAGLQLFAPRLRPYAGQGPILGYENPVYDLSYHSSFETYTAELQQILTYGPQTLLIGASYQGGEFHAHSTLRDRTPALLLTEDNVTDHRALEQEIDANFERITGYLYDRWRIAPWLAVTGGVTYDHLLYPANYLSSPVEGRDESRDAVSPKVGLTLQPWRGAVLRAALAQAIGGASFDQTVRLEPAQVDGFLQSYRTALSESVLGSLPGSRFQIIGGSFEQKLAGKTYFGVEVSRLDQSSDRDLGAQDQIVAGGTRLGNVGTQLEQNLRYQEDSITASLDQLLGRDWSLGVRYRYTHSTLSENIPGLRENLSPDLDDLSAAGVAALAHADADSWLHNISFQALYNHPSGFFLRGELNWYHQENEEVSATVRPAPLLAEIPAPASSRLHSSVRETSVDDFWQLNLLAGCRFHRNQCELSGGLLNVFGQDYRLNPLTPYLDLARAQTWVLRCKVTF